MKISLKWINEFVAIEDFFKKPNELAEKLTRAGLEVEEIINRSKDFENVVVGLILEKGKHPNADKLSLCRVTTGEGVVHQIVCGAQNHKTGDRVVVALPGAVLPGNFQIKNSTIRGVESSGMLCSQKELGLAETSEGLLILPETTTVGATFASALGFDDILFELKVTPNRADCLSHHGLARELSCLLGREFKAKSTALRTSALSTQKEIQLEVKASELCPRYTGRLLTGVRVGESPDWLKRRLENLGLNSINNIVDVTNYVMMELGQPLHAFDADQIAGSKIIVDKVPSGEKFITLDGTEKVLTGEELGIRDTQRTLCLAGVMGGKNSGVTEKTTRVFLEAAYFLPMSVRKTSRAHGLESDSAYRFSRGVDPDRTREASDRAVELILQVAGGEAASDPHDFYPQPVKKSWIPFQIQTLSDRLGFSADEKLMLDFYQRLGCEVKTKVEGNFEVLPPTFRFDLENAMDLVEEYARLVGYENIPETLPSFSAAPTPHDRLYQFQLKSQKIFFSEGYHQAFNFAFVSKKLEQDFLGPREKWKGCGFSVGPESIPLLNPLNEDLNVMRSSLSFGLAQNLRNNVHSGNQEGKLFEIGTVFSRESGTYAEKTHVALMTWGQDSNLWSKTSLAPQVFQLKSAVESWLHHFGIKTYTWVSPSEKSETPGFLHWGQFAHLVVEGKKVGFLSSLHPVWMEDNKIRVPAALAELDFEALTRGQPRPLRFQSISPFPAVERDFAFVAPRSLPVEDILRAMKKLGGSLLVKAQVFDVYAGEKMDPRQKSVAIRMIFQDLNATLQEAQILEVQNKILAGLKSQFDLTLRN